MRGTNWSAVMALGILAAGCDRQPEPAVEDGTARADLTLPISINAAMVGLVDHSADYLFALGNDDLPRNEGDWHLVLGSAYEMMLSGTVIQIPGTGEFDAEWTRNADWIRLSEDLTAIGSDAVELAEAQSTDVAAWRAVGDRLIENCLACHEQFKPEIPSEGILRGSTERQSRGISIFE